MDVTGEMDIRSYRYAVVQSVDCPACSAPKGMPCVNLHSVERTDVFPHPVPVNYLHDDRSLAWDQAEPKCRNCGAGARSTSGGFDGNGYLCKNCGKNCGKPEPSQFVRELLQLHLTRSHVNALLSLAGDAAWRRRPREGVQLSTEQADRMGAAAADAVLTRLRVWQQQELVAGLSLESKAAIYNEMSEERFQPAEYVISVGDGESESWKILHDLDSVDVHVEATLLGYKRGEPIDPLPLRVSYRVLNANMVNLSVKDPRDPSKNLIAGVNCVHVRVLKRD